MSATEPRIYLLETESFRWDSSTGFSYKKCRHRSAGACLRCRVGWFVHLWRIGNRPQHLP